ncbi:putative Ig domain-containing protein [Sphingomonas sp. RT2P30]|uniref:beta strand repeat-containing protein n=1 Tax=Parasphingomonas halimpatiens TaxID=3096162 RepID=UPI002FC7D625
MATASLPGAKRGLAYAATITAGGGTAPYRFTIDTGALPPGLTLATNGALSGTPTTLGTYNFSVVATDASPYPGPYAASRGFSIVVSAAIIAITPSSFAGVKAGVAYSATLSASGGAAPYSYAVKTGVLPAGLSLTSDGVMSGTPTAKGNFSLTITATDSFGNVGARPFFIVVAAPSIAFIPGTPPGGTVGVPYSKTYSASGGTAPYSYTLFSGTLPPGLTLSSAGMLSGTPSAGGTFSFVVQASDSTAGSTPSTSRASQILAVATPTLVFATIPGGSQFVPYTAQVTVTGGTAPYSFSLMAGALPTGLVLGPHGALSGTPTVAGRFTVTIMAVDSSTGSGPYSGSQTFNIDIAAAPDAPLIVTPAAGATVTTATPSYSGTSNAAAGSIVTVTVDSATPLTTAVDGGGSWTVTQPTALAEGGHGVSATVQVGGVSSVPSTTTSFTVASRPTVTAVSPTGGPAAGGVAVTITGTGLSGATAVKFGTVAAPFTIVGPTEIDTTAPAGSGTVDITVTTPTGTSATAPADQFSYAAAVAIGRSWVSRSGLDSNPCTRAAPCLTFQAALALTVPGGELNCLDRAGYGQATIVQSVSILCDRTGASVPVAAGNGIVIAAGPADIVTLSGLDISGSAAAGNGILVQSVGTLRVENSRLHGFTATGANAMLVAPSVGATKIFVTRTSVADNLSGLMVSPASGASVAVAILDATFQNNSAVGVRLDTVGKTNATIQASIDRSLFSGDYVGVLAKSPLGSGSTQLTVTGTTFSRNSYALTLNGPLVATIGLSTIVNNGIGLYLLGGSGVASLGGNRIGGNTTDGPIALTYRSR